MIRLGIQTMMRLPEPDLEGSISLESAINNRRSIRSYQPGTFTLAQIGQLLWAAQGITGEKPYKRTSPSAGGRCPLEFYACWQQGVWHYDPENHTIIEHLKQDIRPKLPPLAWDQGFLATANLVIVMTAVFDRTVEKYGERGRLRYVPMDAGHAAQNILLQATAMGLGSVPVGAFNDESLAKVLQIEEPEQPFYMVAIGCPA